MPEVDVKLLTATQNATLGGIAGTIEVRRTLAVFPQVATSGFARMSDALARRRR